MGKTAITVTAAAIMLYPNVIIMRAICAFAIIIAFS